LSQASQVIISIADKMKGAIEKIVDIFKSII